MKNYVTFLLAVALVISLGYTKEFMTVLLVVSIHEFAHIVVAVLLGAKIEKIQFSFMGQCVVLRKYEYFSSAKKMGIILAGPLTNVVLFFLCQHFWKGLESFAYYNLVVGLFNLVPVLPFDGSKLVHTFLSNRIGVLNTNKIMLKMSKMFSILFIIMGVVQLVLYPFNISLLCIGIYTYRVSDKETVHMTMEFYKALLDKADNIKRKSMVLYPLAVSKRTSIKHILNLLCYNRYVVLHIFESGKAVSVVTETELVRYTTHVGVKGTVGDISDSIL